MLIVGEHCYFGQQMLKKIPFPSAACDIVSRQEEFAGSDYPRGLGGVQIPLGHASSRFADTLDTVTCNRPYRKAQWLDAAREEIKGCSGTQFDSEIVGVFLRMPDNIWEDLRLKSTTRSAASRVLPPQNGSPPFSFSP